MVPDATPTIAPSPMAVDEPKEGIWVTIGEDFGDDGLTVRDGELEEEGWEAVGTW
ncbi:MAG: hypothetical protein FRX48_08324 [Lasallia pustulata]|uniref:Uncharacterized protein n=1 Tax=Lasallia pustulata TaxID=136370 RepID=A0A5M8PFU6_9LECA|nr:MAG: hypothetical protein FRX48_08324 [Lasallia pustulata]